VGQEASSLFSDVVTLVHAGSLLLLDEDGDDDGATVELLRLVQLMWSRCLSQPGLLQLSAHSRLPTHIATSLWVRPSVARCLLLISFAPNSTALLAIISQALHAL